MHLIRHRRNSLIFLSPCTQPCNAYERKHFLMKLREGEGFWRVRILLPYIPLAEYIWPLLRVFPSLDEARARTLTFSCPAAFRYSTDVDFILDISAIL